MYRSHGVFSAALASSQSASISARLASFGVFPRAAKRPLDRRKTAFEFEVGLPQDIFRIGAEMAGEVDHRE